MPSIKPFKGIVYNKGKVKDIARVVAPPYDVIPPAMQEALYKKHNNNIVRLILGKINKADNENDNRYTRAKDNFQSWLKEKILVADEEDAIYVYSQKYKYAGKPIERFGFIALMKLEVENKKKVLPHENTLKAPKEDRLNLMRSVRANLSPIFMLYEDDKHKICGIMKKISAGTKPFIDVNIDNVRHRAWRLTGEKEIKTIEDFMADKDIFIADGHHRYETALNYAAESPDGNAGYLMAYFCELDDCSLTILPTHRLIKDMGGLSKEAVIKRLERYFIIEKVADAKKLLSGLDKLKAHHAFGVCLADGGLYIIRLKDIALAQPVMGESSEAWKNLDVAILHRLIIQNVLGIRDEDDNIEFVKDPAEAFKSVGSGKFEAAFLLNPTKVSQMKKVARAGEKMPKKATYFYPKPISGIVINKF